MYVRDVALSLLRRDHHPVAFSMRLGPVAEELRAATVPVVSDLEAVGEPPDVIHGHHHLETMIALLHFPGVPAISFCHGWLPWEENAPRFPRILRYVAVDEACRDRLVAESGVPPARVEVLRNFVDLRRFRPRGALPPRPLRALVFSNAASEATHLPPVREACARLGIALDVAGLASGRVASRPEDLLPAYDLVFAKARAALEALAVGAAVIVCDAAGLAGRVTTSNLERLRRLNFGIRSLSRRPDPDALVEEIQGYDPEDAEEVSRRIRADADMEDVVARLLVLYDAVIAEHRVAVASDGAAEEAAAARYLSWLSPVIKHAGQLRHEYQAQLAQAAALRASVSELQARYADVSAERDRLSAALSAGREEIEGMRRTLGQARSAHAAALEASESELQARCAEVSAERDRLSAALSTVQEETERMRQTLTWRARGVVLSVDPMARLYRALRLRQG